MVETLATDDSKLTQDEALRNNWCTVQLTHPVFPNVTITDAQP